MGKKKTEAASTAPDHGPISHNPFAALAEVKGAPARVPATESTNLEAPLADSRLADAPFAAKIVVRRENKGRGGKTVTRVSGLARTALEDMASRMKRALGCGASIEGDDLLLSGALVERAATWLEAEGAPRVIRGN